MASTRRCSAGAIAPWCSRPPRRVTSAPHARSGWLRGSARPRARAGRVRARRRAECRAKTRAPAAMAVVHGDEMAIAWMVDRGEAVGLERYRDRLAVPRAGGALRNPQTLGTTGSPIAGLGEHRAGLRGPGRPRSSPRTPPASRRPRCGRSSPHAAPRPAASARRSVLGRARASYHLAATESRTGGTSSPGAPRTAARRRASVRRSRGEPRAGRGAFGPTRRDRSRRARASSCPGSCAGDGATTAASAVAWTNGRRSASARTSRCASRPRRRGRLGPRDGGSRPDGGLGDARARRRTRRCVTLDRADAPRRGATPRQRRSRQCFRSPAPQRPALGRPSSSRRPGRSGPRPARRRLDPRRGRPTAVWTLRWSGRPSSRRARPSPGTRRPGS